MALPEKVRVVMGDDKSGFSMELTLLSVYEHKGVLCIDVQAPPESEQELCKCEKEAIEKAIQTLLGDK